MKNRKIITLPLMGALLLGLGSCSLLKKEKAPVSLPTDREQIQKDKTARTYLPEELNKGIVKGDWAIEKVNGKNAVGEKAPFIKFDPSQKRFYGNNGCNVINGSYAYNPADSVLSFSDVVSTMMACAKEGLTDYEINNALNATRYYSWEQRDSQYFLYFYNAQHKQVMTLMHQNFQFLNGTWAVTAINEEPVDEPDMKIVIDIDEGKLHGNTGCNILNGTIETDRETANSISFQKIITTRMACPDSSHETEFIVALEEATYARPISPEKVLLLNPDGKVVLELVRAADK